MFWFELVSTWHLTTFHKSSNFFLQISSILINLQRYLLILFYSYVIRLYCLRIKLKIRNKNCKFSWLVVAQTISPSTWKADAGGSFPEQLGLYEKTDLKIM